MPACSPNRPSREVLDRLIEEIAWAKTCLIATAATDPNSADRNRELAKLRQAVIAPRKAVDEIFGKAQSLPQDLIIDLRTCELAIPKLEAGAVLRQPGAAPCR
jgi:hypothetical protein